MRNARAWRSRRRLCAQRTLLVIAASSLEREARAVGAVQMARASSLTARAPALLLLTRRATGAAPLVLPWPEPWPGRLAALTPRLAGVLVQRPLREVMSARSTSAVLALALGRPLLLAGLPLAPGASPPGLWFLRLVPGLRRGPTLTARSARAPQGGAELLPGPSLRGPCGGGWTTTTCPSPGGRKQVSSELRPTAPWPTQDYTLLP